MSPNTRNARQLSVVLWDETGTALWSTEVAVPTEVKGQDAYEIAMRFAQMLELQLVGMNGAPAGVQRAEIEERRYQARAVI